MVSVPALVLSVSSVSAADPTGFVQTNLVSDVPGLAAQTDANLKNPWGLSFGLNTPFWISDQGSNVSTLYDAFGTPQSLVVGIAPSSGRGPTGQVFAAGQGFTTSSGAQASVIVATLDGHIDAWSGDTTAATQVTTPGASYTGLALAGNRLYAADAAQGQIDVFDSSFQPISMPGAFADPDLPKGFTPFNIQSVGGKFYVTYARQALSGGFMAVFDSDGRFLEQLRDVHLDSPWGMALAPAGFGEFGNDLLIGNFGNGQINAFDPVTERFLGTLSDANGNPLVISGLWALAFRSPGSTIDPNALFFTAGINGEADGLFGEIQPASAPAVPEPSTMILMALGLVTLILTARRVDRTRRVEPSACTSMVILAIAALTVSPVQAADVLYVKAAHVIVNAGQPAVSPGALVITDGIVTAAGANLPVPPGARQIDLGGLTVMPSLIDAHTHFPRAAPRPQPGRPMPLATPAYAALQAQRSADAALKLGVAAMRVLGSSDFVDVAVGHAIDDGVIPGPHVIPAAHPLSIVGGHTDFAPLPYTLDVRDLYTPLHGYISSPADAERAVQLQIKFGARVIKLMASGGVGSPLDSPADEALTLDEMRAAVQQAHMHHLKVAAHAESLQAILDAIHAGVDSIEHGSDLNQEALDAMKRQHIMLVPTLRVAITSANETNRPPPGAPAPSAYSLFKAKQLAATHEASIALALKSGVTMAAGSDNAYPPGSTGIIAELVTDVEHGMSAPQALVSATVNGAALLGLDTLGTLAPGMEGDFIAMDGDPLADIHAIERIRVVVFKGVIVTDKRGPTS
jgi:uncharacterized protein (TIGR03118 family)